MSNPKFPGVTAQSSLPADDLRHKSVACQSTSYKQENLLFLVVRTKKQSNARLFRKSLGWKIRKKKNPSSKHPLTEVTISPWVAFINTTDLWRWTRVLGLSSGNEGSARCWKLASAVPQEQSDGAWRERQRGCWGLEWRGPSEGPAGSEGSQRQSEETLMLPWDWTNPPSLMILFRQPENGSHNGEGTTDIKPFYYWADRIIQDLSDEVFLSLPWDRDLGLPLVATVSW